MRSLIKVISVIGLFQVLVASVYAQTQASPTTSMPTATSQVQVDNNNMPVNNNMPANNTNTPVVNPANPANTSTFPNTNALPNTNSLTPNVPDTSNHTNNNVNAYGTTTPTAPGAVDASINSAYQSQLSADANLRSQSITATTQNGVVTLSGTVDTQAQADQAAQMARSLNGVQEVRSNITVRNQQ